MNEDWEAVFPGLDHDWRPFIVPFKVRGLWINRDGDERYKWLFMYRRGGYCARSFIALLIRIIKGQRCQ